LYMVGHHQGKVVRGAGPEVGVDERFFLGRARQ